MKVKKSVAREETVDKYLSMLESVHEALVQGRNRLDLVLVLKHFKLSIGAKKSMFTLGILSSKKVKVHDGVKPLTYYYWVGSKPSRKMANDLAVLTSTNAKKLIHAKKAALSNNSNDDLFSTFKVINPVEKSKVVPVKDAISEVKNEIISEVKNTVTVSLFWGAIKFSYDK